MTAMTRCADLLRFVAIGGAAGMLLAGCSHTASMPTPPPAPVATKPTPTTKPTPAKPGVDKGDPDARFKAALALMKDKQIKEAQDAFAALAKDFPNFSGAFTDLGILQVNTKQRAEAVASFQRAVRNDPKNVVALNWLGTLARENNDYPTAERAYLAAIAAKADYAPPHLNLGELYDIYLKRPADALTQYREYQRLTNSERLVVSAWIKELEASQVATAVPATAAPAGPAATPAAPPNGAKK